MSEGRDELYRQAGDQFAPAIARLARAMERDADKARDLEQEIHCEIWRSLERFDNRCSLKTWIFRVSHNVAADHVVRAKRRPGCVALTDIEALPEMTDLERATDEALVIRQVGKLIETLPVLDSQVILLWLEGESAQDISEITGLKPNAVSVRVHRVKALLAGAFGSGLAKGSGNE